MAPKSKDKLKEAFSTNKIPTESDFADLIDSVPNLTEDVVSGPDVTFGLAPTKNGKNFLNFFNSPEDDKPAYAIFQSTEFEDGEAVLGFGSPDQSQPLFSLNPEQRKVDIGSYIVDESQEAPIVSIYSGNNSNDPHLKVNGHVVLSNQDRKHILFFDQDGKTSITAEPDDDEVLRVHGEKGVTLVTRAQDASICNALEVTNDIWDNSANPLPGVRIGKLVVTDDLVVSADDVRFKKLSIHTDMFSDKAQAEITSVTEEDGAAPTTYFTSFQGMRLGLKTPEWKNQVAIAINPLDGGAEIRLHGETTALSKLTLKEGLKLDGGSLCLDGSAIQFYDGDAYHQIMYYKESDSTSITGYNGVSLGYAGPHGSRSSLEVSREDGIVISENVTMKESSLGTPSIIIQEKWRDVEFEGGWSNLGYGHNPAGYFKDSMGIVHLRGVIMSSAIETDSDMQSETLFYISADCFPSNQELLVAANRKKGGDDHEIQCCRIDVQVDGRVLCFRGNGGWISLDGLTYRAAPS